MIFSKKYQTRILLALAGSIIFFQWIIPAHPILLDFFIRTFFTPSQKIKSWLTAGFSWSLGEWLYSFLVIFLLYIFSRWVFFLFKIKNKKSKFYQASRHLLLSILGTWLLFAMSWNVIYKRPRLLPAQDHISYGIAEELELNEWILEQLAIIPDAWDEERRLNEHIISLYHEKYEGLPTLRCKATMWSDLLQAMGIQGYYNPLTSEAQINAKIPQALQPFVIAHELAHVLGVAAEGDANLIAFELCHQSDERYIRYSALLNLYLYNIRKIRHHDSAAASQIVEKLPNYVQRDLEEIKTFHTSRRWNINRWTLPLYNWFLKLNGDQQGLRSYGGLTKFVYMQQLSDMKKADLEIRPFTKK